MYIITNVMVKFTQVKNCQILVSIMFILSYLLTLIRLLNSPSIILQSCFNYILTILAVPGDRRNNATTPERCLCVLRIKEAGR